MPAFPVSGGLAACAGCAVLDTGFDLGHPDLAPNINYGLSRDFTGEGLQYAIPDPFSHGTHTAGTSAAADNGFGTIGIAPEAELVLIKVLRDAGSGTFGDALAGMLYATDVHARIASMSLGGLFPRHLDRGRDALDFVFSTGNGGWFWSIGTSMATPHAAG